MAEEDPNAALPGPPASAAAAPVAPPVPADRRSDTGEIPAPGYTEPISVARAGVRRRLGETDLRVYPAALSTKVFGWTVDRQSAMGILDRYHLLGGNLLDTDPAYGAGHSQTMVGSWLHSRHARDRMVVATRVGRDPERPGLRRRRMHAAVDASLTRLQTDHVDLLFLALDDPEIPLEDTLASAHELIAAGKVRELGAVGYSAGRLTEARVLSSYGLPKLSAIQVPYSLMNRSAYEGDLELLAAGQGLGVLPLYPLAHGFLSGQYRSRADGVGSARRERAGQYIGRRGSRVLGALGRIAQVHQVTPATIALAWLLTKRGMVAPVASADDLSHVDAMIGAADVRLSRAQVADLERASA